MLTNYEQKRIHDSLKIKKVGNYYDRIFAIAKHNLESGYELNASIKIALDKYGF